METFAGQNIVSIPPETLFESLLRYSLYLGAGFQLVCLLACILLPGNSSSPQVRIFLFIDAIFNENHLFQGEDHDSDSEGSLQNTPKKPAPTATTHHRRKDNKKKRR